MAGALAERRGTALPGAGKPAPRLEPVEAPAALRRTSPRLSLGAKLVIFGVCMALLAVGRVTLSFAVVQKNLQTQSVMRAQRELRAQNGQLASKVARLASTVRIQKLAIERYGLVPAQNVLYVPARVPAARAVSKAGP